jgi:hypothetical protein
MIGLLLLAFGAVALWAAFTGRATNVLSALKMSLPTVGEGNAIVSGTSGDASGSGSGPGGSNDAARAAAADSGEHSALTDGGLSYIIKKSYGDMTDGEKHDANNYAHNQANMGSG